MHTSMLGVQEKRVDARSEGCMYCMIHYNSRRRGGGWVEMSVLEEMQGSASADGLNSSLSAPDRIGQRR